MLESTIGVATLKAATVNPSKRQMRAIERDAEARIAMALDKMRRAVLRGLTADNAQYLPGKLSMQEVLQPFTDSIVSVLRDIALAGASFGREQIERFIFGTQKRVDLPGLIDIDWELVNVDAEEWARAYGYDLVRGIGDATQRRLQKEVSAWVTNNESINKLRDRLSQPNGPFSLERARTIAVTETTRAYAEGNRAAWRQSGVVKQRRWNTNVDELVCPICGPMHNVVIGIDETFEAGGPPAHPNCRCWITPVVEGAEERETGLGQFGLGPGTRIPEAADITRRDQKVIDAMGPIERETINQKYETAGVYDVNGRELFRKDGNEYSVAFSRKDAETMKGQYLTHNHPGIGASFSDHDMRIAHGQELKKIRAVGVNPRGVGTQYDFDILDDAYYAKNKGAITRAYNEARKNAMKEFQQKIKNGMPVNEANYEVTHRIMELFTSKINSGGDLVKYTRGDFR